MRGSFVWANLAQLGAEEADEEQSADQEGAGDCSHLEKDSVAAGQLVQETLGHDLA